MSENLFSSSWHRVCDLAPRLRGHARIQRQHYRGEIWFVIQDTASERHHRLSPAAYQVVGWLDGERTLQQVWQLAAEHLGDDAPSQDELIRLLGQLHAADVLVSDASPDTVELFDRFRKQRRRELVGRFMNPMAIRIPLLDPERFLTRTLPYVRPFLGIGGAVLWLAVVLTAAVCAALEWDALTENALDQLFTPQGLLAIWLLFPVLKALHELGHGYAVKALGGQVHDMGLMLLVFTPVPYVDASAAWSFDSRWQRALVGAGGMLAELFVASLALFVWMAAEPGAVRAVAYNVLLVGGATTLLFNANPLLRFDGYYIACDVLELPNLVSRANAYLGYLFHRYVFGRKDQEAPHTAPGEAAWFVFYPIAAFAYRIVVVAAILTWLLEQSLVLGTVLGVFAIGGWLGKPLVKGVNQILRGPALARVRTRAVAVSSALLVLTLVLFFVVPAPMRTRAEGVVWVPEEALVRAGAGGFVTQIVAAPDSRVAEGAPLIETWDPELETEVSRLEAHERELEARYAAALAEDIAQALLVEESRQVVAGELARARERAGALVVRAGTPGRFVVPRARDLEGRFVRQGDVIAHIVDLDVIRVRAVVTQDDLALVRTGTRRVHVRLAERLSEVHEARVARVIPAPSHSLPSAALGSAGGGEVPIDPADRKGDQSVQPLFEVELEVPAATSVLNLGGRVYVRFEHDATPLGLQWVRRLRQVFLSRFHV